MRRRRGGGSDAWERDDDREPEFGSDPDRQPAPIDSGTITALRQADPHTRAQTLLRMQRLHGNEAVQRIVRALQVTDAGRDARIQMIGERTQEPVPSDRLEKAELYREAVAAELDASPAASKSERELIQDNVNTVGQIFSNYQAALHLFEDAVRSGYGETVPRDLAIEVLREAAHDVFAPVLDACVGVAPGLDDLVAESMGKVDEVREAERPEAGQSAPAHALRNLVIAERQRVAITHSRLIKRQVSLMAAGEERAARTTLIAAAQRLDELETGSHSARALFRFLLGRWLQALRGRAAVSVVLDAQWTVLRAHIAARDGRRLAMQLLADGGGLFDLNRLHLTRHVVWQASDLARLEAFISPDGKPIRFDRNEAGAPFFDDFQRRLREDGLPRTKVLSGD
jgi:hypothetical protein